MKIGGPREGFKARLRWTKCFVPQSCKKLNITLKNTLPQPCISEIANHGDNYPARTQTLLALPLDIEIHVSSWVKHWKPRNIYIFVFYIWTRKEGDRLTASKTTPAFIYYSSPSCNFQSFNYNPCHFLWLFNRLHQTRNKKIYISTCLNCIQHNWNLNMLIAYNIDNAAKKSWLKHSTFRA